MINRAPPSDMHKPFEVNLNPDVAHAILSFERDVTEKLWSEKEKLAYAATPLFLLRAEKPVG